MVPSKAMKSLINVVENAVPETLSGACHAYPQLEYNASHKVVLAPKIAGRGNKVSLICGGGSGHEPFAAGFVGSGMLTASVAGAIFAAPPSIHIEYAINRVSAHNKGGVLVIIPNYTGDCLNFGIAIEKARRKGLTVADIIVGEDCSIPKDEQGIAGRRGLTGMLFIIKIAGALAERGLPLQDITKVAHNISNNMATYAVGLTACAIPGQGPMFELGRDEIECGMGVHGETGYERVKLQTANEVVSFMLKHICEALHLVKGDSAAVLINNFGALSQLEQGIVVHEVVTQLKNMDIQPLRVYSGVLMTSLNSAGVHITLLKLPKNDKAYIVSCLDDPTSAPRWPGCAYSIPMTHAKTPVQDEIKRTVDKIGIQINAQEQDLLKHCVENACAAIIKNEGRLNDLDRGCGDGDCGTTLRRLADGIMENLNNWYLSHPSSVFSEIANIAEERMGGTSGALYCLFFNAAAKELASAQRNQGWPFIWSRTLRSSLDGLLKYGKAEPGDRTMIDALNVACVTYETMIARPVVDICDKVAAAAWQGCEATKNMKPRAGRASYVKQVQYLQEVDAGAYAVATWISAISQTITNFKG